MSSSCLTFNGQVPLVVTLGDVVVVVVLVVVVAVERGEGKFWLLVDDRLQMI